MPARRQHGARTRGARALEDMVRAEQRIQSPAPADPGSPEPDDSTLLRLARSGDRDALDALCRRSWRPVYRSFARLTADPAEAEDLTQEVFVRALRALPQFEDRGLPYTAYLLRIAGNTGPASVTAMRLRIEPVPLPPDVTLQGSLVSCGTASSCVVSVIGATGR